MNAFLKYAARRFAQFVFVIFTGITLAFIIAHLSPVDPVEQSLSLMTGFSGSDPRAIEILRQSLSELYGVKGSVIDHYLIFWRRVLTGDFGPSLSAFPTPVMTIIQRAMPWTFGLLMLSTIFAWIVGNTLGALAGYFRNNRFLKVIGMGVMAMQPLPTYIVGLSAGDFSRISVADPSDQRRRPGQSAAGAGLDLHSQLLVHGTLPALTLVLVGLGGWFISMRSLVSNIVTDDHVVYAELAGVRSRTIFSQYVARNAMLPQVTGLALNLGHVFSGAVIVEFIFGYPGMGQLLIAGIYAGDYSLVLGVTTIAIISVATAMFLIDILYPLIDPRVKLG